ncbi:hypothetical protein OS493_027334 [Desmophyllum pertusum]|uniref:G-protein coupled receptors family 1 profile domain-containing protein n=1 Tax=Desmophyllum pertusum TaxID=174260 RepID=A0A9X0CPT5_9CNID|nr:hypothetical protein OS493_027334 [Desmophyllum pertusum]
MHQPKPLLTKVIMSVLTAILTSSSMLGNGFVLAVIGRFKSLRTVPNILIANLAVVDLLNSAVNLPLHLITILEASWYRGKTLAIMNSFLNRVFVALNLASMLAMMVNTYLAIAFDFKYFTWKTKKKALVCVFLIWLFSIVMVMLLSIPLLDINIGEANVSEYRAEIFKQGKHFVAAYLSLFIISGGVLSFLTTRSIKKKKNTRAEMNLPPLQAQARLQNDIKASITIAITITAYFLSYVPTIVYAVMPGLQKENQAVNWFALIAWYSLYFSSAVNPIIYYLRSNRFRSAFKQFLKDPLGSSDFKEKPNGRGNGKRWNVELMARKVNGARGDGREAWEVERDAQQRRQKYPERRNALVILSIENPKTHPCVHQEDEERSEYERTKEQSREARALKIQMQNQCERKEKEAEERNEEVAKNRTLEMVSSGKQLPSSSRTKKVHPLGVTEMYKTGDQDKEEGSISMRGEKGKSSKTCTR